MSTFALVSGHDDHAPRTWVAEVTVGPAGTVAVMLGGVTLRLDALNGILCEIGLVDPTDDDREFLRELFGSATSNALVDGDCVVEVPADQTTPVWLAVRGLARGILLAQSRRPGTDLQFLEVILALQRLGHPAAHAAARHHADAVRPAVTALARIARQNPSALDLPAEAVRVLVTLLRVLRALFADPASGRTSPKGLDALLHALSPSSDSKPPPDENILASLAERLARSDRLLVGAVPSYEDLRITHLSQSSATVDVTIGDADIAPRLGRAAQVFVGPVRVVGRCPGVLRVEAPLASVPGSDRPLARVQIHGPDGTILASGNLVPEPRGFGSLPSATCQLNASATPALAAQISERGIFVDLVPADGPEVVPGLDADTIEALSAARAQRAGKDAFVAGQTGDRDRARSDWDRCAAQWRLAGDQARAEAAEVLRDAPSDAISSDWLVELFRALEKASTGLIAEAREGTVPAEQLGLYLEALEAVGDDLLVAAAVRQALVELTPAPDDEHERGDWRDESRAQLEMATTVCLRAGGFQAAEMARRLLTQIRELG